MQILRCGTHFFTFGHINIVRSLSHFCSFNLLRKSFWLNHICCKWDKIEQKVAKLATTNKFGLQNLTSERFRTLTFKIIWICWPFLFFWLFNKFLWQKTFVNFPPPYLWHNRDRSQASICPTYPPTLFPFPHQTTTPQECNFIEIKRKWV